MKMKRNLPVILFLLFSIWAGAQTIAIDDPAFEDALIALGHDSNPVRDGVISIVDADMVTDLNVSNRGISDLSGLEFFSAVETLDVSGNDLDELVLQNLSLVTIKADNCNLAGKQIRFQNNPPNGSFLTNVISLSLAYNGFGNAGSSVSFGGVPNVEFLNIQGNSFGRVQLNGTLNIKTLFADDCTNLDTLSNLGLLPDLEGLTLSNCNFDALDVSANTLLELLDVSSNTQLSTLNVANGNNAILVALNTQSTALDCIQVDDPVQAANAIGWEKDATTTYAINCNSLNNIVEISLSPNQTPDADGNYVITSGTDEIFVNYDLRDENGSELPPAVLNSYQLEISTIGHPTKNTATGGIVPTPGVDFELITADQVTALTTVGAVEGSRRVAIGGDGIFEADEFFLVEVRSNDTNITLKNATNGVVQLPVRIIDNEITDINLELVNNGTEGGSNARLRITSSLENNTGAPMPFNVSLGGGSATFNQDYQAVTSQPSIPNGASSVEFDVPILNLDILPENVENFFATIAYAGTIDPLRVVIEDGNQEVLITDDDAANTPFNVTSSIGSTNVVDIGQGGGPIYEIEEGEILLLNFEADASAPLDEVYIVQVTLSTDSADENDVVIQQATPNLQFAYSVKSDSPDNILRIEIKDDMIDELGGEDLKITLSVVGNNFTLTNTNYDLKIQDKQDQAPTMVTATLDGDVVFDGLNYFVNEGGVVEIFVEAIDGADGESFVIPLDLSNTSATSTDYSGPQTQVGITINSNENPDGKIRYQIFDNDGPDPGEKLDIILDKPLGNYEWKDANTSFLRFQININEAEPVLVSGKITGLETDEEGNYLAMEGEEFAIEYNVVSPIRAGTNLGFVTTAIKPELSEANSLDYIETTNDRMELISDPTTDVDMIDTFRIVNDGVVESEELLVLSLFPQLEDNSGIKYKWLDNTDLSGGISFQIKIIDGDRTDINAVLDNAGGYETSRDTLTISLEDINGNAWTNPITSEPIKFRLRFENFDHEQREDSEAAEDGDYALIDGGDINSATIIVEPGQSSGTLVLNLREDQDPDDKQRENYTVTVLDSDSDMNIGLPPPLEAVIIDKEGKFLVSANPAGGLRIITGDIRYESNCCRAYTIEEGEDLIIEFKAEKGVPIGTKYKFEIEIEGAVEPLDYKIQDNDNFLDGTTRIGQFDNRYIIKIEKDDLFDESEVDNQGLNYGEYLKLTITPPESANYTVLKSIDSFSAEIYEAFISDVIPVSIDATTSVASENPLQNGEFTISLDTDNPKTLDTRVFYELDASSTASLADVKPLLGYVDIAAGELSASLVIEPIDDDLFEPLETLNIALVEGDGYSISDTKGIDGITIDSEDIAEYTVKIKSGEDFRSRESDASDFAEVLVELDKTPDKNVAVIIKISDITNTDNVIEGQDYTIFQEDKSTVLSTVSRTVLFESGGPKSKSLFIKALPDDVLENNESLWLTLDAGVNYRIDQNDNRAEVELISSVSDTSSFDPGDIKIVAQSPRCPGDDQLGDIFIENDSPFPFEVHVVGLEGIVYDKTLGLDENDSDDNTQLFDGLIIGNYQVSLVFKADTQATYPDVILPSYIVQIVPFDGMTVEQNNLLGTVVSLNVSGSTTYEVATNLRNYLFEFNDVSENSIEIPLEPGLNELSIKGDSECKGIIQKSILLNSVQIYPNPGKEIVFVNSVSLQGRIFVQLFDISGKLVYQKSSDSIATEIRLDISTLENGLYLGTVKTEKNDQIEFKLLKN